MNRTTIYLLVTGLFCAAPEAFAQMQVSGSVTGGYLGTNVNTERNPFRFDEYRDLKSGVTAGADIRGDTDKYFVRFFGENMGRDDQFLELTGGQYGAFKYSVYNNDIIHHLTYGARTPFTGWGSPNLSFAGPLNTNPASWDTFNYQIKHENYGGTFELQASPSSPFYFRATANQKDTKGIKPIGSPGTSPGGPTYELPAYVNYTTTDASAEAGWATKTSQFSLNASWSKFESKDDFISWRNASYTVPGVPTPIGGPGQTLANIENTSLTPDNNLWKIAANAMWKQLPLDSTLALRGTYSKLTNDVPIALAAVAAVGTTGTIVNTNPSAPTFNGNVVNKTVSASLTSNWARGFDSRLYWNWSERQNKSTDVVFTPTLRTTGAPQQACDVNAQTGVASATTCSNELFHYKRDNLGVDLQYRFNPENRISGGWDYSDTERERIDFERTKDNKVYVEWKNSSLDMVTGKIKYQHLQRRSDFALGDINPVANANNLFNFYLRRFDLNDKDQDLLRLTVDATPMEFFDVGGQVILKKDNYKNATLGRKQDDRQEYYLTAAYGDPSVFRVSAYLDFETTRYDSSHWVGNPVPATFPAFVSGTQYLWTGKVKDKNWVLGVAADWPYSERLKFKGSLIWQDTDGTVDMAANGPAVPPLQNVPNYDSFKKTTLDLRGTYVADKNIDVTFGFSYERFRYSDLQMDGYSYVLPLVPVNQQTTSVFGGAYAFQNYNATILYATIKYSLR